jgi:uncharacterized membrane protein
MAAAWGCLTVHFKDVGVDEGNRKAELRRHQPCAAVTQAMLSKVSDKNALEAANEMEAFLMVVKKARGSQQREKISAAKPSDIA